MKQLVFISCLFTTVMATAQTDEQRKVLFNLKGVIALAGFDPVSYFDGKAVKGKPTFKHPYKGVTYFFSSPVRRDNFKANPAKYEPVYGGWCAYAMGTTGKKVEVDPLTFKVVDGKLHLFYNKLQNNTLEKWNEDESKLKAKADDNWGKLLKEAGVK